jgi:putative membrane protein
VTAVAIELVLLRGELTAMRARQILGADIALGISALIVLLVGLLRVFYFEKGGGYYMHSAPFIAKLSLFALVALLSIYPTMQFLSWRAPLRQGQAPALPDAHRRALRLILHIELAGIVVILLCAALMAKGVGYFGLGAS